MGGTIKRVNENLIKGKVKSDSSINVTFIKTKQKVFSVKTDWRPNHPSRSCCFDMIGWCFAFLGIHPAVMVKMVGLSALSEGAPVGVSPAGTLGVHDFSELGYRPALLLHKTKVL